MTVRPALGQSTITTRTLISFAVNALIIFSTIHAQDFRDEVGDKLMGRRTIPIVWPKGSRVWILAILTAWSVGLSWACDLAIPFSVPFCSLSLFVGLRFFRKRTAGEDRRSYLYYNVRCSFESKQCFNKRFRTHAPFVDMACGCPSRAYFVPVTGEAPLYRSFEVYFTSSPLISVLSCFHFHTAGTWTSTHYPYIVGRIVQL